MTLRSPFEHVEILGPRAGLDAWLVLLQEHGALHVADAMTGLEGEPGIGRPLPTADEREAEALRRDAARVLRAVERVLPRRSEGDAPTFAISAHGDGRDELERNVTLARESGGRIFRALEAGREADGARERAEADKLLVEAVGPDRKALPARVFALTGLQPRGLSRLVRRLRKEGAEIEMARSPRQVVLAVFGDVSLSWDEAAYAAGARILALRDDLLDGGPDAALGRATAAADEAERRDQAALRTLREAVEAEGHNARRLLDAIEDAEARSELRDRLAATEHVVAVRAWVPREALASLTQRLDTAVGHDVVLRRLPPVGDAPALPRHVAPTPFAALSGLALRRFGGITAPAMLAIVVPLAFGLAWADVGGGLILLVLGALLGLGASPASPRKDTALLAQTSGLLALVGGILSGRAFGALGIEWFGNDWRLLSLSYEPWHLFALLLGTAALLMALWGGAIALVHVQAKRPIRAVAAGQVACHLLTLVGFLSLMLGKADGLSWAWLLAPAGGVGALLLSGIRDGGGRLLLDLVAFARLGAVGAGALLASDLGTIELAAPGVSIGQIVLVPVLIVVGALAAVIDPAHVAMGVPYDLSLGGRALAQPYQPFRTRGGRGAA